MLQENLLTRRMTTLAATLGAVSLTAMAVAPALAATTVSQASATALTISVAGNGADSGTILATNDGTGETKTGEANPPVAVLGNQDLLDVGVLAQDAEAKLEGRQGVSAACSGVAGDGASIADVGESECLTPGDPVGISIANLDLTGAVLIDPESALAPLVPLNGLVDQLVAPLTAAISDGLAPFGATGLGGTLGAVQASCTAGPDNATTGTANIVDTKLQLDVGGAAIDLVNLPVSPPPNTKVLTNLDVVLDTVIEAVRVDINTTLDAQLAPLSAIIDPIQDQIVDNLIAQIAPQLAPLEDNILEITLNRQSKPAPGAIEVTALVLNVLPAAAEFTDGPLVAAEIGTVTCGPNDRIGDTPDAEVTQDPAPEPTLDPQDPAVPTIVDAGASGDDLSLTGGTLGAGLVLLTGVAGLLGYRRLLHG